MKAIPAIYADSPRRLRGCAFSERFSTAERFAMNGGSVSDLTIANGLHADGGEGYASWVTGGVYVGFSTVILRFSVTDLSAPAALFGTMESVMGWSGLGWSVWVHPAVGGQPPFVRAVIGDGEDSVTVDLPALFVDGESHTIILEMTDSQAILRLDGVESAPVAIGDMSADQMDDFTSIPGFVGTVELVEIYEDLLDETDKGNFESSGGVFDFVDHPYLEFVATSFSYDAVGGLWRCKGRGGQNLTLGDGEDPDTIPEISTGINLTGTEFLSGWPTGEGCVWALVDDGGGPAAVVLTLAEILALFGAPGAVVEILRLAFYTRELTEIEEYYLEFKFIGIPGGFFGRSRLDGTILALYHLMQSYDDFSGSGYDLSAAGVSRDSTGARVTTIDGSAEVLSMMTAQNGFSVAAFVEADTMPDRMAIAAVEGGWEFAVSPSTAGRVILDLNGSSLDVEAGSVYAVSLLFGDYPKFFVDGEYAGEGDNQLTPFALSGMLHIGNLK